MKASLKPGQKLNEIEIVDFIGFGPIGEVYSALRTHNNLRQPVIIKCFSIQKLQQFSKNIFEVILKENQAVCKINHPNIERIYEARLENNLIIIIKEALNGGDLAEKIAIKKLNREPENAVFSPLEISSLGTQLAAGIMTLHNHKIYHGNLKPKNIYFRDLLQEQLTIVDYGQAGIFEGDLQDRLYKIPSLGYISPEKTGFMTLPDSPRCDLYSLGIILYELALGNQPFFELNEISLINRLLYEVPKPLHKILLNFPLSLSEIISKLIRKNPGERYNSAEGLLHDLARCQNFLIENKPIIPFALGSKDKIRELNYHIPLVGRVEEIQELHKLFSMTLKNEAAMVLVGAPSGTGKSRLALEVLERAKEYQTIISSVKFSEYERNLPLSVISSLLAERYEHLLSLPSEQISTWKNKVIQQLGNRTQLIIERYPSYAALLQNEQKFEPMLKENGFQLFNQTLGEFLSLLPAAQETQLLVVDDMQWADWQSLQVFSALASKIINKEAPKTMFLGTYRSNEISHDHPLAKSLLSFKNQFTLIELGPLSQKESNLLVEYLLDEKGPEILKLQLSCFNFTRGNPFYIYEYLKSAINKEIYAFETSSRTWSFHEERILKSEIDSGVAGLIIERIKNLRPIQQAILSLASITGHSIKRSALLQLLPLLIKSRQLFDGSKNSPNLEYIIELTYQELLQKNLLIADPDRFVFFHDKIRETCYLLLNPIEKMDLHHRYGHSALDKQQNSFNTLKDGEIFEAAHHICQGRRKDLQLTTRNFLVMAAKTATRVFAYEKSREYLTSLLEAIESQPAIDPQEHFIALELMADTLSISDQIAEAMLLYDKLLTFDCDKIKRAHIFAKKVEFSLTLFDYQQAKEACVAGLDVLDEKILTTELASYFYIILLGPWLVCYCLYFRFFGNQTKEIESEFEQIRFQLLIKSLLWLYFTKPIVAIANLIPLTFSILKYKDNDFRMSIMVYWAGALSAFGFKKFTNRLFSQCYAYFDRTANPVDKGFVLFSWAFCSDFPQGNLEEAQNKLEAAVSNLAPIGESFWRSISIIGLLILDYLGAENGQAGIRSHELTELWLKVRYSPNVLALTLRHHLEVGNSRQIEFILQTLARADVEIEKQGYDSLDSLFASIGLAEYFEFTDEPKVAEKYAHRAFKICLTKLHRINYGLLSPLLYARFLTKRNQHFQSLTILLVAWINQILQVKIFMPQTCYETGRWFFHCGWPKVGRIFIENGIRYANRNRWFTPAAEGRLLLGQMLEHYDVDLAKAFILMAKEYFQSRQWKFHENICEIALQKISQTAWNRSLSHNEIGSASRSTGTGLRKKVETQALMNVLLKLSAITNNNSLFEALMEALCQATGSELAVLYFEENGHWVAKESYNISITQRLAFNSKVDSTFISTSIDKGTLTSVIRSSHDFTKNNLSTTGSAMLLPLISEAKIYGYCYLANTQILDLFDQRSIEIAQPIATQGAIALQNIRLNKRLVDEEYWRAETQQNIRLELYTRVMIVSDLAHRMNNPLNYIASGLAMLKMEMNDLHRSLILLLSSAEDAPEAQEYKNKFSRKFAEIRRVCQEMQLGINLSAESVIEIRSLSGVDGYNVEYIPIREINNIVNNRLNANKAEKPKEIFKVDLDNSDKEFPANRFVVGLVLELILRELQGKSQKNQQFLLELSFYTEKKNYELFFTIGNDCIFNQVSNSDLLDRCNHLLKPYGSSIRWQEDTKAFYLLFPSFEDKPTFNEVA